MVIDFGSISNLPYEFDKMFNGVFNPQHYKRRKEAYPPVNIGEDNTNIYVHAEMPGIDIDDLDISITPKDIVIKGERKLPEGRYFRQERISGIFQRIVAIHTSIDVDKASATIKDGVLLMTLPKVSSTAPKKVAVEIE
ncbi:Hsp20/alpha crystallin family protein [Maridesulfovibrio frigidus]|uniref:Hsp20/alpha crystallin family protein n=1 Tax=Maridesulfovibrio frigidus TaxID=340956 RepID=UPI0004E2232C|nr:Hsp20/alpha crystallin family protein [Maridesulfovibrio frigidus]